MLSTYRARKFPPPPSRCNLFWNTIIVANSRVILDREDRVVHANWIYGGPTPIANEPRYIASRSPDPKAKSKYDPQFSQSFFSMVIEQKAKVVVMLMSPMKMDISDLVSARECQNGLCQAFPAKPRANEFRMGQYVSIIGSFGGKNNNRMAKGKRLRLKVEDIIDASISSVDGSEALVARKIQITDRSTKEVHVFSHIMVCKRHIAFKLQHCRPTSSCVYINYITMFVYSLEDGQLEAK